MGRRKHAAAFSLFSFQDIITSVTAILILVMILLTIELVTRRRSEAVDDLGVTSEQIAAASVHLESLAGKLHEEVDARRAGRTIRTLAAARIELARMERELSATSARLTETRRVRDVVSAKARDAEGIAAANAKAAESLASLLTATESDMREAERLEKANAIEKERQEARRSEIGDSPRVGTELVFHPLADSSRRAWLVELSGAGVTAVLLGGDRSERFQPDAEAGSGFPRWVGMLDSMKDYCLLLVRPSATDMLESEVERTLIDAGIRYGIDFIGEEQAVRDGSKSAADH